VCQLEPNFVEILFGMSSIKTNPHFVTGRHDTPLKHIMSQPVFSLTGR
jgi:hypothetical protein